MGLFSQQTKSKLASKLKLANEHSFCLLLLEKNMSPDKIADKIAVAVTKNKAGKILIIQRVRPEKGNDDTHLTWAFPGGRLEVGEKPEDAVVREVSDETGFTVVPLKKISERRHPQFDFYVYYIACDLDISKVRPANEIHEVLSAKWVEPDRLSEYFETNLDSKVAQYLGLA